MLTISLGESSFSESCGHKSEAAATSSVRESQVLGYPSLPSRSHGSLRSLAPQLTFSF